MNVREEWTFPGTNPTRCVSGYLVVLSVLFGLLPWDALGGEATASPRVAFTTDVRPLLTKFGCNSGGCHGKTTGQNGFKLSLLGYEPAEDYKSLVRDALGRRIFLAVPEKSLVLLKATGTIPHGGGRLLARDSEDYDVLRRWIEQGAPAPRPDDPVVQRVAIEPADAVLSRKARVALQVRASLSDGSTRDVTRLALYESNEPEVAEVSPSGEIEIKDRGGLFAVMVRYGDRFGVFHGTVPFHDAEIDHLDDRRQPRPILRQPPVATTMETTGNRTVAADRRRDLPSPREPGHLRHDSHCRGGSRLPDRQSP